MLLEQLEAAAVWGKAKNYCVSHVTRVMPMDLWGTFLGCVQRVRVCSMVKVGNGVVTRADTIA